MVKAEDESAGGGRGRPLTSGTPAPVVPAALREQIGYLIRVAHFRALDVARTELPPGADPRHFGVMQLLAAGGSRSQQQLATELHVNPTMLVELIDELEGRGLVERRRNPDDRRSYALRLTAAGRVELDALLGAIEHGEDVFLRRLDAAQRARLNELLRSALEFGGPLPGALADRTGFLLAQAQHRAGEAFSAALDPLGLAPRHGGALTVLVDIAPCSQRELARQLDINPTIMVETVDFLEQRGLVKRERNPADRRSYALAPTARGRDVAREVAAVAAAIGAELGEPLGERGARELRELLLALLGA